MDTSNVVCASLEATKEADLKEYLYWPITPERVGLKRGEKHSFVITSNASREFHLPKQRKKNAGTFRTYKKIMKIS